MNNNKYVYKTYIIYFGIIAIAYSIPPFFASIFLIGLFLYGIFIEKDIVKWLALFLLISNSPGFIFSFADANYDLKTLGIGLTDERGVSFQEFFILLLFFFALKRNNRFISIFKKMYIVMAVYIFLMFILSIYDLGAFKVLKTVRGFIPHLAFFFLPVLLMKTSDYRRLIILLIPFPLFVVFIQVFELVTQQEMIITLGSSLDWGGSIEGGSTISRQNYSQVLLLFVLFGSFYLLNNSNKNIYSQRFLYIIIGLVNISIFISATRGYFLASFIGTILYLLLSLKKGRSFQFAFYGIIIIAIFLQLPIMQKQFIGAYERIASIGEILTDIEGAGIEETSRIRYFNDMMDKFSEKPFLGYSFTQKFWEYSNIHSGFPTNLINGGVVGLLIILYFFTALYVKVLKWDNKNLKLLAIALTTYIVVHATSNYIFNYVHLSQADSRALVIPIIYSFFSTIIIENKLLSKENARYN